MTKKSTTARPQLEKQNTISDKRGTVISVRGSIVDVRFEKGLPPIYTMLSTGADDEIAIEVQSQLNSKSVRDIALTPTQGLARGMVVTNTGGPLQVPVGRQVLSRMFN